MQFVQVKDVPTLHEMYLRDCAFFATFFIIFLQGDHFFLFVL